MWRAVRRAHRLFYASAATGGRVFGAIWSHRTRDVRSVYRLAIEPGKCYNAMAAEWRAKLAEPKPDPQSSDKCPRYRGEMKGRYRFPVTMARAETSGGYGGKAVSRVSSTDPPTVKWYNDWCFRSLKPKRS